MTAPAGTESYPSAAVLRQAHAQLLHEAGETPTPQAFDAVEAFLARAVATGTLLDSESERWEAQGILDYWAARLYRAKRAPATTLLADFEPTRAPVLPDEPAPYVGLKAFDRETADLFFGRERLVDDLIARIAVERFLAVLGPSGSGKSSLVLGGLLPAIARGVVPGSEQWTIVTLVPGADPVGALARATGADDPGPLETAMRGRLDALRSRLDASGRPSLVVVDQLEEIFTLCGDDAARHAFAGNLLALTGTESPPHRVLVTMRSDFEDRLPLVPELQRAVEAHQVRVTPLSAEELARAIERPAARVGLRFADGVVDRLVREVLGEPAGLPLLQFTLSQLWARRQRNRVTMEAYDEVGGGRLALAKSAEQFHASLIPEEQETMKRILLRMVQPGDGLEVTSRPTSVGTLLATGEASDRVRRVLDRLIRARLLKVRGPASAPDDERQVELAHEALVRNWPTLVSWVEEARVGLRRRTRLTAAAEQWASHQRDPGGLLGGTLLEEAKAYDDLTPLEQEFVSESQAVADRVAREAEAARLRELEQARAAATRLKQLVGTLILALVVLGWTLYYVRAQVQREAALKDAATRAAATAEQQADLAKKAQAAAEAARAELESKVSSLEAATARLQGTRQALTQVSRQLESSDKRAYDYARTKVIPLSELLRVRVAADPMSRDQSRFRFACWLTGNPADLARVRSVEYFFNHPTFNRPRMRSEDERSGFRVSYDGWGCLSSVIVTITDLDGHASTVDFDMCGALQGVAEK